MADSGNTADIQRKREAVAALYETHFERVARYIAVRIGDPAEADDLASEAFIRALRSVDSYQDTGAPLSAWVFRIAHNLVVDHLRRRSRRPASVPVEDSPSLPSDDDPQAPVELQESIQELHEAMAHLTEDQQQVLALRFSDDEMTANQVAEILGRRPGAVREMQSAAIKRLRIILGGG